MYNYEIYYDCSFVIYYSFTVQTGNTLDPVMVHVSGSSIKMISKTMMMRKERTLTMETLLNSCKIINQSLVNEYYIITIIS